MGPDIVRSRSLCLCAFLGHNLNILIFGTVCCLARLSPSILLCWAVGLLLTSKLPLPAFWSWLPNLSLRERWQIFSPGKKSTNFPPSNIYLPKIDSSSEVGWRRVGFGPCVKYLKFVNCGTPPHYLSQYEYTKKCVNSRWNSQNRRKFWVGVVELLPSICSPFEEINIERFI